jgi:hypothetical protein
MFCSYARSRSKIVVTIIIGHEYKRGTVEGNQQEGDGERRGY